MLALALSACGSARTVTRTVTTTTPSVPAGRLFRIPSGAMEPTLPIGDAVYVVSGAAPMIGDIVVFHPPAGAADQVCGDAHYRATEVCPKPTRQDATNTNYIKRVVAGPGDTIAIRNGHVILNGKLQKEPFANFAGCGGGTPDCNYPKPLTVPPGYYFMLGDNRDMSDDSRFWGPVPRLWIEGRAEALCRAPDATCRRLS
jgi:signal peptidase I